MGSADTCVGYIVLAVILSPVILQGIGMFTTDWVTDGTCAALGSKVHCCNSRSNYSYYSRSCEPPFSLSELDTTASSFQGGAFAILILPIIFGIFEIWCNGEDSNLGCCAYLGGCCFLLYPVAGLLSFIGCMIIAAKFSSFSFGSSFNTCLASGLYVLGITGLSIAYLCYKRRRRASKQPTGTVAVPAAGGAAPIDGGPVMVHTVESHVSVQEAAVHDSESGLFVFIRSVNIFHMITHQQD